MKPTYDQKMNWLAEHLPFIKLDNDLLIKNMKTAHSCITLTNTKNSDANFYLPKKMANAINGTTCTYDIILNINIFPDQTYPDHLVYSLSLMSAEQNFVTTTYNQCINFICQEMKESCIKFSAKEFLMIKKKLLKASLIINKINLHNTINFFFKVFVDNRVFYNGFRVIKDELTHVFRILFIQCFFNLIKNRHADAGIFTVHQHTEFLCHLYKVFHVSSPKKTTFLTFLFKVM